MLLAVLWSYSATCYGKSGEFPAAIEKDQNSI
jgi:hypothetical protein